MSLAARSREIIREEGVYSFMIKALHYIRNRFRLSPRSLIYLLLWRIRDGLEIEHGVHPAFDSERPVFADLFAHIEYDDIFYDVGAYHGLYTVPVGTLLSPNNTVAFEPGEGVSVLQSNLERHNIQARVVDRAISQNESTTEYYQDRSGRIGSLRASEGSKSSPDTITDEEILESDLPLPNVIKIDVRGTELDVIRGMEKILDRPECRLVYLELHVPVGSRWRNIDSHRQDWSFDEILHTFHRFGFECELMFVRWDDNLFMKAHRPE